MDACVWLLVVLEISSVCERGIELGPKLGRMSEIISAASFIEIFFLIKMSHLHPSADTFHKKDFKKRLPR